MDRTPARCAASTSRQRSPTLKLRSRSRPSRPAASRIIPGLRLAAGAAVGVVVGADDDLVEGKAPPEQGVHPVHLVAGLGAAGDVGLVGDHDQHEAQLAQACAGLVDARRGAPWRRPRAAAPECRRGSSTSFSTPSRSRKTADRGRQREGWCRQASNLPARASTSIAAIESRSARGARALVLPAQRPDAVGVEPHDRHVALPAAVAARVLEAVDAGREADALDRQRRRSRDGDVVPGRDVEDRERVADLAAGGEARRR